MDSGVIIIGASIILVILSIPVLTWAHTKYWKSDLEDAFIRNEHLIILSNIYHSGGDTGEAFYETRIARLLKNTGQLIDRKVLNLEFRDKILIGHLLIVCDHNRYVVVDLNSFEIIFNHRMLFELRPDLKNEGLAEMSFNKETRTFHFRTLKDNEVSIHLNTLTRTSLAESNDEVEKFSGKGNLFSIQSKNSIRYNGESFQCELDLLKPQILMQRNDFCLVLYFDTIAEDSTFLISRIRQDGSVGWTLQGNQLFRFRSEIKKELAFENGNDLLVGIRSKWSKVFCMDAQTGKVKWKYKV